MILYSTRIRLILSFISVSMLVGVICLVVGGQLLYDAVLNEARSRVRQDLSVARLIYDDRIADIRLALEIAATAGDFRRALVEKDTALLGEMLERLAAEAAIDFAGATDAEGRVICRAGPLCGAVGVSDPSKQAVNPIVRRAIERGAPVSGTVVMDEASLMAESTELARRAVIRIVPEAGAVRAAGSFEERSGLVMVAAAPVEWEGRPAGIFYGGILLNRNFEIVDTIGNTVFQKEIYEGRNVGTATIFFGDLRVATNVLYADGGRAIGTYAAKNVSGRVLAEGLPWTDRAFVVNDWYVTAYAPITDIDGRRVGMLYVGVLEGIYHDVRIRGLFVFTAITLAGMLLAVIVGWLMASRIIRPINALIRASAEISEGNLSPDIGPVSNSDIGLLQKKFSKMTHALREWKRRNVEERECTLIQSEKQASIGRLAAGVAHEINNPLTAVLTFTHLMLRRTDISEDMRADLQTVAKQTERVRQIVKGLLDFSRQTTIRPEPTRIDGLLNDCAKLMRNQAMIRGVALDLTTSDDLPELMLDRNQFQSVVINMIINALDSTESGGSIHLSAVPSRRDEQDGVAVTVRDTGDGIPAEHLDKLFDPFFTTKEVGQGTGLGLAVSAGIVQRHDGTITVESREGEGSAFTIWLPAMQRPAWLNEPSEETHEDSDRG